MGRRGPKPRKGEAITRAALELFVERGVRGATTREIARRAHSTEGSLYRYYPGKQDLARSVLRDCLASLGESMAQALDGVVEPRQRLRLYVETYLEYASQHPLEHAFIVQSQPRELDSSWELGSRPRTLLIEILSDGMASQVFHPGDPRWLAPFLLGGLDRAFAVGRTGTGAEGLSPLSRELIRAVERFVLRTDSCYQPRAVVPPEARSSVVADASSEIRNGSP